MKNLKSWYTTILGMLLSVLMLILFLAGRVDLTGMFMGIAGGIVLVFFKDEWATELWKAFMGLFKKKSE